MVPRLTARVGFPAVGELWKDTAVAASPAGRAWRDLFTGRSIAAGKALPLAEIFAELPFAVLVAGG